MAQDPWAQFPDADPAPRQQAPQPTQQPRSAYPGVIRGAPKDPPQPREPKTTYRTLTPEEAAQRGLPAGQTYQISSDGKVDPITGTKPGQSNSNDTLDPKTQAGMRNIANGILQNTGVKLETGEDPVADLIMRSTSGGLQSLGAQAYGYITGDATDGMKAIGALKPMLADMTLQMTGGSLGANISNDDRKFIMERMGNIADPEVTAEERLASWNEVKRRLAQMSGIEMPPPQSGGDDEGLTGTVTDDSPNIVGGNGGGTPPAGGGGGLTDGFMQGLGDIAESAGDTIGIIGNPLNATVNALLGTNLSTDMGRTVREGLGLPQNQNALASAINQGAAAALGGAGIARSVAPLINSGAWRNALTTFGRTPVADTVAGAAAGGAGQLAEQNGAGPIGQVGAALAGGAAGYTGANAAAARILGRRIPNEVIQAADDLGVQMMPADVGGVGTRMATGGFGRTLGGIPIAEGAQKSVNSAAAARTRIAGEMGSISDEAGAGQAAKRGFDQFEKNSAQRAEQLYQRISVPADRQVELANTRGALAEVTRGLESNPQLSKLWTNHPRLRATLEALTPTDNREAGQVQFTMASDKVRGAEDALVRAREAATRDLQFEQSQARDAVEGAQRAYDTALSDARAALTKAQDEFDAAQTRAGGTTDLARARSDLMAARSNVEQASARFSALRDRDPNSEEVQRLMQPLRDAEARFNEVRFKEPQSDEMRKAQEAISVATAERDQAFVTSRQAPSGGQLSWKDMNRFRSIIGEIIGQPGLSRDGSDIAALRKLYGALTTDMEITAAQAGPRALSEFRRATQYFRGREARINDVFATLLGKDGNRADEQVFRQINTWAQSRTGDFRRVAQTIRSMPDDEAGTIRATIVQRMGMARPSKQDATQEVFSPAEFATQWRGMSSRAKAALFPNKQHRQDLEKFAMLADQMKRADEYQNFSNTALGANVTGQALLTYTSPVASTLWATAQFGAGKLLASPRFARAIASTYKLPEQVARRKLTEQLSVIATREPLIANDVRAVLDYINKGVAQLPGRAAANEESDSRSVPPQQ